MRLFLILFLFLNFGNIYSQSCIIEDSALSINIISRQKWEAKKAVSTMKILNPERITIHHDGVNVSSNVNPVKKMKSLQEFSQKQSLIANGKTKKAWPDIPYHFVIFPNGDIYEGREISYEGDTNTDYSVSGHILIDVAGNFETQKPTTNQLKSLEKLCAYLCDEYKIASNLIGGHNDYAETLCPGKNLTEQLIRIKEKINKL